MTDQEGSAEVDETTDDTATFNDHPEPVDRETHENCNQPQDRFLRI